MIQIPYGEAFIFRAPLIDAGTQVFTDDQAGGIDSITAGDVQVQIRDLDWANVGAESIAFTSGSEEPLKGHILSGDTSAKTMTVIGAIVTSGSWGGGTAAGILFVELASGAFQSETLTNDTTTTADVMNIGADVAASTMEYDSNFGWAFAITSLQAQTDFGIVRVKDQDGPLWEDQDIHFKTIGRHPLAGDPQGVLFAGTATAATAGTLVLENLDDGIVRPLVADENIGASLMVFIRDGTLGAGQAVAAASYAHSNRTLTLLYNWPLTPTVDGSIDYELYSIARMPAHVIAALSGSLFTEIEDALATLFDITTDSVNDGSASTTIFETLTDQSAKVLYGVCRLTSGALDEEARVCKWTGTTMTVLSDTSMDPAQKQWSAAPANSVTFKFTPIA